MRSARRVLILVAVAALIFLSPVRSTISGDEGFWLFSAPPRAAITQALGFEPTDAWLTRLQRAAIRFGTASGSFVAPGGLVLTNHHVGLRAIQRLSTPDRDLVQNGFYAVTLTDELKAPDMELSVLMSLEDVTAQVDAAETPGMTPAQAFAARRAAISAIEKASQESTGLKSEVVTLYQGALYHLYRYKTYTDVRLVFAPEFDVAFYGGDPDNFTYPRYCLDVCFFRVYENDRPAQTADFLPWALGGVQDDEPVFVAGHPGSTQRLNTVAHLEYLRDTGIPWSLTLLERRHAALTRYEKLGAEQARQAKDEIFSIENSLKSYRGQVAGLNDPTLTDKKRATESRLREAVRSDPARRDRFGGAWDAVEASRRTFAGFYREHALAESAAAFNTRLFSIARTIVRLTAERAKPDGERLPEYTESRLATLERTLYSPAPVFLEMEKAKLADSLAFLSETLGAEHPLVRQVLGGRPPAVAAATLVDGTALADVEARKTLVAGGARAVAASTDPMVALARAVDGQARRLRQRYEDEVAGIERDAYAKIAQALFAVEGPAAYPDATSTLRLTYGRVRGYEEIGARIAPFTDFAGLYARAAAHDSQPPYRIVDRWLRKKASLKLDTPYTFVSTLDIVGGNSGSPVVNRRGEVVGVVFDGNIQSLPGYFVYDAAVNRAVAVDGRAILEALRTVYEANRLVDEITSAAKSAGS